MGISAKTKFKKRKRKDSTNAQIFLKSNRMLVGLRAFTLETFIHEINELEVGNLLKKFGLNPNVKIRHRGMKTLKLDGIKWKYLWYLNEVSYITHLASPYGDGSLIYPSRNSLREQSLYATKS